MGGRRNPGQPMTEKTMAKTHNTFQGNPITIERQFPSGQYRCSAMVETTGGERRVSFQYGQYKKAEALSQFRRDVRNEAAA